MFEAIENPPPRHWRNFVLHSLVACFIVPIAGLGNYWITPVVGVVIAICTTRALRDRAAIFAIVPSFLLFALASMDPISSWELSWSHMTHWQYFKNTMFGPNCGDSECLYTVFTAIFTGGIGYMLGAYLVLWKNIVAE
jgi:hypothetical protein